MVGQATLYLGNIREFEKKKAYLERNAPMNPYRKKADIERMQRVFDPDVHLSPSKTSSETAQGFEFVGLPSVVRGGLRNFQFISPAVRRERSQAPWYQLS